ncbi:hypothetical protein OH77DRAFT_1580466 [Trametes cingulata]|nr:hypothetical protein OH77DRAFT_1580466 [Trametes cingulata]
MPTYGDAAYGFAPHYNPTVAFVDHFAPAANTGARSILARITTANTAPTAQPHNPTTMTMTTMQPGPGGGAGHMLLFRYMAANAPPLPVSIKEVRQLKVAAEMENTQGMRAIAALCWWISQRQSKGYQPNDIEKEVLRFRLPAWFKEKYEPKRHTKDEQRARGQLLAEPRPTDPTRGTTKAQAPTETTDGLGAATPGGVLPNTTQAELSNDGPADVPVTEDVPMEDNNPEV